MATKGPFEPSMIFRSRMTKLLSKVIEQKACSRSLASSMSLMRTSVISTAVLLTYRGSEMLGRTASSTSGVRPSAGQGSGFLARWRDHKLIPSVWSFVKLLTHRGDINLANAARTQSTCDAAGMTGMAANSKVTAAAAAQLRGQTALAGELAAQARNP